MSEQGVAIGVRFRSEGAANVPPAPARFSMMMACPSCVDNWSNTTRGTISVVLPAAKGTIAWMGFVGQASACASSVVHPTAK